MTPVKVEQEWRELHADTSWIDGRDVVLLAYGMEVQARYCPGEPVQCGLEAIEYDGAVWSCFDDKFQIEIEEISDDPAHHHSRAANVGQLVLPQRTKRRFRRPLFDIGNPATADNAATRGIRLFPDVPRSLPMASASVRSKG